jgi:hypothetical protein
MTIMQIRRWSARQRRLGAIGFAAAFLVIGEVGQTLPPTDVGRVYPVQWWNWVTLAVSAALLGLIAATFAAPGGRRVWPGRAADRPAPSRRS